MLHRLPLCKADPPFLPTLLRHADYEDFLFFEADKFPEFCDLGLQLHIQTYISYLLWQQNSLLQKQKWRICAINVYPWKHVAKHHNLLRWRTWKVHKHICRQISASLQSTQAPWQPDPPPSRFFDGAGDHLGSWVLPSRAFKEASTSSSVRPCLTPQTTVLYCQVKYRTTLGEMITQIWSFSSCLVFSHPFQRFRSSPSLFLSEAASALSPTVYPHPLVTLSSSNFTATYVHPASLSQRKWLSHLKNWWIICRMSCPAFIFC